MQSRVKIDFQGMEPSEALRAAIVARVAALEDRFARITACRVVLKAPSGRHLNGGLYEINIRLTLPGGKEIDIGPLHASTSAMPTFSSRSTMLSSGRAAGCRTKSAVCRVTLRRMRVSHLRDHRDTSDCDRSR